MIRVPLALLALVVAGCLLAFLQSTTPRYATLTGPIITTGVAKDTVAASTFSVQVEKVERARTLVFKRYGRDVERSTDGTWLLVSAKLAALAETMPVNAAAIRGTSGRLYTQTRRADGAPRLFGVRDLHPGLPASGIFVFELPVEETERMTLILSRQPSPRLDDEVHVTLDPASVERHDRVEMTDGAQ